MTTGVPSFSSGSSRWRVRSLTRMHPALAERPIEDGSLVPWIASWFPPLQPAGRCGWIPEMPNANEPSGPPAENGMPVGDEVVAGRRGRGRGAGRAAHPEQRLAELRHGDPVPRQVDLDLHVGRERRRPRSGIQPSRRGHE